MLYRRKTYRVLPEQVEPFSAFFSDYLLPSQRKHGARLVGRWATEDRTEIMALWEYRDAAEYEAIEQAVRSDPLHAAAQAQRARVGPLYESSHQEFLTPTGIYDRQARVRLSASACVTNERGDVLLVRTNWRPDTWELPGGQVDAGETPAIAVRREVLEETGIEIRLKGVSGVYFNLSIGLMSIVFRAVAEAGSARPSEETSAVRFVALTEKTLAEYVTRPQFAARVRDAMHGTTVPLESFEVRPYAKIERFEG
jgi:8-oxo-dGTP diphosphatase